MTSLLRLLAALSPLVALALSTRAAELPIIAKARAFVGAETALDNLKSVHFTGTLIQGDPADASKQLRSALDIVFQKPAQQRITATSDRMIETTALDGYDGWQRVQDAADPTKWRQTLLGSDQIKRLRANTWENLGYWRGIERVGGRVEDQGVMTIDGVTCQKVAFIHGPAVVFIRYFDQKTGRLVLTETESGGTIRESGEIVVSGIRFPKSIITTTKNQQNVPLSVTIQFDQIKVNEPFPPSHFAVPILTPR